MEISIPLWCLESLIRWFGGFLLHELFVSIQRPIAAREIAFLSQYSQFSQRLKEVPPLSAVLL